MTQLGRDQIDVPGKILKVGHFKLAADVSTASADTPPTVVALSGSYTKLSATSKLLVEYRATVRINSSSKWVQMVGYHGTTGGIGSVTWISGANEGVSLAWSDEYTGIGGGAVTLGVKYSSEGVSVVSCAASASPEAQGIQFTVYEYE